MNETIEFAILFDKYTPTLEEVKQMAQKLWDKHKEKQMEIQQIRNESQDAIEIGITGKRVKIHYWTETELDTKLKALKIVLDNNEGFIEKMNTK